MSEISIDTASIGFFGKMPSRGDFVRRSLPDEFVDPWDRWLQEVIAHGLSEFSETWLESYLTAPIWRFYLAAGVLGSDPWLGVIMPSVDNVNRYFPLSLVARAGGLDAFTAVCTLSNWFDEAEQTVLQALEEDNLEVSALEEQVANLPPIVSNVPATNPQTVWCGPASMSVVMPRSLGATELRSAFSDILLTRCFEKPVVFWCVDDAAQHFRLLDGLDMAIADYQWIFGCGNTDLRLDAESSAEDQYQNVKETEADEEKASDQSDG